MCIRDRIQRDMEFQKEMIAIEESRMEMEKEMMDLRLEYEKEMMKIQLEHEAELFKIRINGEKELFEAKDGLQSQP